MTKGLIWISAATGIAFLGLVGGWFDQGSPSLPEMAPVEPAIVAYEFTLDQHSLTQDEVVELNMHCWQGHERACLVLREFRQAATRPVGNFQPARYCRTAADDCADTAFLWRG